jgi:FAD/FMN-containing dehydrogenase
MARRMHGTTGANVGTATRNKKAPGPKQAATAAKARRSTKAASSGDAANEQPAVLGTGKEHAATDKIALMSAQMVESFPVANAIDIQGMWQAAAAPHFSIAGFRCSQGGHTLADHGQMLTTELFTRPIEIFKGDFDARDPRKPLKIRPTATVAAGTLWSQLHHELNRHGLAPLVHQSSAHFSVGGSISVNCHGRDPRQGPVGNSVNWLEVLLPDGTIQRASPTVKPDLFRAVVGGYGSCGVILQANLTLTPNLMLEQVGWVRDIDRYAEHLDDLVHRRRGTENIHLHYGWLRCTDPGDLYDEVLIVDYKDAQMPQAAVGEELQVEAWGAMEIMRAGWAAIRHGDLEIRERLWNLLREQIADTGAQESRLNWMRAAIAFTAYRGKADQDILQEYFVPVEKFHDTVNRLRTIFQGARTVVRILSTTVRVVRRDEVPGNLSYCSRGDRISIAVDMNVDIDKDTREPVAGVVQCIQDCLAAIPGGGTYYLPYYPFATRAQFDTFYQPAAQRNAIAQYNPARKLQNLFMQRYL